MAIKFPQPIERPGNGTGTWPFVQLIYRFPRPTFDTQAGGPPAIITGQLFPRPDSVGT